MECRGGGVDPPSFETEHNLKLIKKFQVHDDVPELFLLFCEWYGGSWLERKNKKPTFCIQK